LGTFFWSMAVILPKVWWKLGVVFSLMNTGLMTGLLRFRLWFLVMITTRAVRSFARAGRSTACRLCSLFWFGTGSTIRVIRLFPKVGRDIAFLSKLLWSWNVDSVGIFLRAGLAVLCLLLFVRYRGPMYLTLELALSLFWRRRRWRRRAWQPPYRGIRTRGQSAILVFQTWLPSKSTMTDSIGVE
jgi:hypothetical protein